MFNSKLQLILCTCLMGTCIFSCTQQSKGQKPAVEKKEFRLPDVPEILTSPEERATYLALHYWDHFDFRDTLMYKDEDIMEQAFVNFVSILPYTEQAQASMDTLFSRASQHEEALWLFMETGDKYLYEPNSPMHNEELYILQLRAVLSQAALSEADTERPRHRLEMALKNRPGDVAADFTFALKNGKRQRLHALKAERLLVYFNDPECEDCIRTKEEILASTVLNEQIKAGTLTLLSVCVEGKTEAWKSASLPKQWLDACDTDQILTREKLYDLKAMPTLYLLDHEKRVILKDATLKEIEEKL